MAYASYQGKVSLAKLTAGVRGVLRFIGNVPNLEIQTDSEKIEHQESTSGNRSTDFVLTTTKTVTVSATLEDYSKENIALAVSGLAHEIASGSVVDQELQTVAVGDSIKLDGFNITALMISDSTGTPVELDEGTHYELDVAYGKVTFLSLTGITQPLIADYTTGAVDATTIMSSDNDEYYLLFEGVNTADENKKLALELWRVKKDSNGTIPFIHEELGELSIEGTALSDLAKPVGGVLGQFGRIVHID